MKLFLDVIYYLVEDHVFEEYMAKLYSAARRYMAILSPDDVAAGAALAPHVRFRKYSEWVKADTGDHWNVKKIMLNPHHLKKERPKRILFHIFASTLASNVQVLRGPTSRAKHFHYSADL